MTATIEPTLSISQRARRALAEGLRATGVVCDDNGYVEHANENVLCPDVWLAIQHDLTSGAGDELGTSRAGVLPKFCAAHSSSALAANAFGPWRNDARTLSVGGMSGFTSLQFEYACSAGVRGTAPHLDLVAHTSTAVLAIESKCTEYLQRKVAAFPEAYERIDDIRRESPWFALVRDATLRSRFGHLDAAQLVKHYLGLANTFSTGHVVLLYLFWEPENGADFEAFAEHRHELEEFARIVAGDRVEFVYQSYPELWTAWHARDRSQTALREHVDGLRRRYLIRL